MRYFKHKGYGTAEMYNVGNNESLVGEFFRKLMLFEL